MVLHRSQHLEPCLVCNKYSVNVYWMVGWMDGWMVGWMDGWLDGWMYGWLDGWMDGWSELVSFCATFPLTVYPPARLTGLAPPQHFQLISALGPSSCPFPLPGLPSPPSPPLPSHLLLILQWVLAGMSLPKQPSPISAGISPTF